MSSGYLARAAATFVEEAVVVEGGSGRGLRFGGESEGGGNDL